MRRSASSSLDRRGAIFRPPTERLVLDVAASQATIGLQQKEVAERRRAVEALHERDRESRLIMDTIPGLVAILTPAGEVDGVNNELVEYCGQPLEDMKQWGTNGTVHFDDLSSRHPSLYTGAHVRQSIRLRGAHPALRWSLPLVSGSWTSPARQARTHYPLVCAPDRHRRPKAGGGGAQAGVPGHLAEAQRLSKTGSFITDLLADHRDWSEEAFRIFKLNPTTSITLQAIRGPGPPRGPSPSTTPRPGEPSTGSVSI